MPPDHGNPSAKPVESTEEKLPDSDHMAANEDGGDNTDKISDGSPSPEESTIIQASYGDENGFHQRDLDSPDRETTAEHKRSESAYSPTYEEYTLLLEELNEERTNAVEHSKKLQMMLAPVLAKKTKEELETVLQGPMHEESYERCVEVLTELKEDIEKDRATAEQKAEVLRALAAEKLSKVGEEWQDLLSLKRDVAVAVLSRRLAKPDAQARVESTLASEQMYQDELTRVRLHNLGLENRIRRLKRAISDADRNATNPFQREYEKLHAKRTERKKYMEKQVEEALRVQKKVVRSLEVLSDIKKTIHCTETDVQQKCEELAQMDAIISQKRDTLSGVKRALNSLQRDNMRLKEECGLLGNEVLLRDYSHTTRANAVLEEKLKELKYRHADLKFYLGTGRKRLETI